jgi:hypothetical protein
MNPELGSIEQLNKEKEISYNETYVKNFSEASSKIIKVEENRPDNVTTFLILDVDGVIIDNNFIKRLPFLCHAFSVDIRDKTEETFNTLYNVFRNRMAIATNRDRKVRFCWNSDKIMEKTDTLATSFGRNVPTYEKMQKQVPLLARKRVSEMVDYICRCFVQSENYEEVKEIRLFSIQDTDIVVPNRRAFLYYLAKNIQKELDIKISIDDYVIK